MYPLLLLQCSSSYKRRKPMQTPEERKERDLARAVGTETEQSWILL